jgi:hypothetical protein
MVLTSDDGTPQKSFCKTEHNIAKVLIRKPIRNSVEYNTVVGAIQLALLTEGSLHNIFFLIFVDMA